LLRESCQNIGFSSFDSHSSSHSSPHSSSLIDQQNEEKQQQIQQKQHDTKLRDQFRLLRACLCGSLYPQIAFTDHQIFNPQQQQRRKRQKQKKNNQNSSFSSSKPKIKENIGGNWISHEKDAKDIHWYVPCSNEDQLNDEKSDQKKNRKSKRNHQSSNINSSKKKISYKRVFLHPSSVNFHEKLFSYPYLVYLDRIVTSKWEKKWEKMRERWWFYYWFWKIKRDQFNSIFFQ